MSIGRICIRTVELADPHESVQRAARRMLERSVGTLVVVDRDQQPVGLITDRDLAVRVVAAGKSNHNTHVEAVMTRSPASIGEDMPLEAALSLMRSGPYRRLLVVDAQGRLAGLLSVDDVLDLLAEEFRQMTEVLSQESPDASASVPLP